MSSSRGEFVRVADIQPVEILPGFHGRFIHSAGLTVAHWEIVAGSTLPTHTHPQEMMVNMIEGKLELTVDGQTRVLEPGVVAVIPGNVPHSGRALTDCRVIDVWHPPRDDYRARQSSLRASS
jgi:quercetin dioxygenase-like cupin family protein